jgi:2-oxoisovalerate dehydrogenase E1 component
LVIPHTTSIDRVAAPTLERLFRRMLEIRVFEEALLESYRAGTMTGTTHTAIGQESVAVAALDHLVEGDLVVSNHRNHAHFLAAGGDPRELFLEILGDARGPCRGIGGSQHLHRPNFYSNGVLGSTVPVAAGLGLALRLDGTRNLVVCFLGDGAFGEGVVYETLNIASLWRVPTLFVVENNGYAQTTPIALNVAGSLAARPRAFGIETIEASADDVAGLHEVLGRCIARVRQQRSPCCAIVRCDRLAPHSKGDDHRDPAELAAARARDPIALARVRVGPSGSAIEDDVRRELASVCAPPDVPEMLPPSELKGDADLIPKDFVPAPGLRVPRGEHRETMLAHLQRLFASLMAARSDVYLLGEDLLDPYGGAFKVYAGLSTAYPGRVLTTPVSEAAIVGLAGGLALRGFRPVVEIMFGDFLTLAFDQVLNGVTKFQSLYGTPCPVIIRTPMGGRRGYGPTHSQSIEKLFMGVPGLVVLANDPIHDQPFIWDRMLAVNGPCLYVENKALYGTMLPVISDDRMDGFRMTSSLGYFPTARLAFDGGLSPDATVIAYGGLVLPALRAARMLFDAHELIVEVVVPSQLAPIPIDDIVRFTQSSAVIAVVEEGSKRWGFGAELIAQLAERQHLRGRKAVRIAAPETIIPASAALERSILPDADQIVLALVNALS